MKVSVIVPAYNSEKFLELCLKAILKALPADGELIAVIDPSSDGTADIAKKLANKAEILLKHAGRAQSRNIGMNLAEGEILIHIDSDVVIFEDTIQKIIRSFEKHSEIAAITGLLSKTHPNPDFFSQYKNLYMHYIFMKQPEQANFLYGSIHAIRKKANVRYDTDNPAEDTALGQKMTAEGKAILLIKELEVVHLKHYSFLNLVRNDFWVPFVWTELFVRYQGWRQMGKRGKAGYGHASIAQLSSILSVFLTVISVLILRPEMAAALIVLWICLNSRFLFFLTREKGTIFGICSLFWTFLDHLIMATGILCGFTKALFKKQGKNLLPQPI